MRRYRITLEGRTYDVRVLDDPRQGRVRVQVDGETLTVEVQTLSSAAPEGPTEPESPPTAARSARRPPPSERLVTAPLPGLVKSIAVRPRQAVARGDRLLVIEAMKMDNVIRAPRDGTVDTVHVAEGGHVAHGDALLALAD